MRWASALVLAANQYPIIAELESEIGIMSEEPITIITRWSWRPNMLTSRIVDIRGGKLPENIRQQLIHSSPPEFGSDSELFQLAKQVAGYLAQNIPEPTPLDLGGESQITGVITGIHGLFSRTSENPNENRIICNVEYSNGITTEINMAFQLEELPKYIRDLMLQIHRGINISVREWFWDYYCKGEINPKKWKAEKVEVFISYRASGSVVAEQLFDALGNFNNSSTFLPRIDKVDLQAGNWLVQLMKMIDRSSIFLPILTRDYLEGPIAWPELDQALRQTLSQRNKRIVPILIEDSPKDYVNHFIGGFHMIEVRDGLSEDIVKKIAYICLGISSNPYE